LEHGSHPEVTSQGTQQEVQRLHLRVFPFVGQGLRRSDQRFGVRGIAFERQRGRL